MKYIHNELYELQIIERMTKKKPPQNVKIKINTKKLKKKQDNRLRPSILQLRNNHVVQTIHQFQSKSKRNSKIISFFLIYNWSTKDDFRLICTILFSITNFKVAAILHKLLFAMLCWFLFAYPLLIMISLMWLVIETSSIVLK